jgi:hypothetical protein
MSPIERGKIFCELYTFRAGHFDLVIHILMTWIGSIITSTFVLIFVCLKSAVSNNKIMTIKSFTHYIYIRSFKVSGLSRHFYRSSSLLIHVWLPLILKKKKGTMIWHSNWTWHPLD